MSEFAESSRVPLQFWIVSIGSLLWNSMGGLDYVMTKTHNAAWLKDFTPEQIAWLDSFPFWANLSWALGVWGAIAGSILLILRKGWAYHAFAISLAGLAVSSVHQFVLAGVPDSLDTAGGRAFNAVLWAAAIGLLIYARHMRNKGVLR